ncbi:MAG: hypothetical protein R3C03_05450 [Pirellulaceae bacterium]
MPRFDAFAKLNVRHDLEPTTFVHGQKRNAFAAGRVIGDEFRYVLDRQTSVRFPGNMLQRPTLLLNPWSLGPTENRDQNLEDSSLFAQSPQPPAMNADRRSGAHGASSLNQDFANLDFLADGTVSLLNLKPDENGRIRINKADLNGKQHLTIVIADLFSVVKRTASLPESAVRVRDLRLKSALSNDTPVSKQKKIEILDAGKPFRIKDVLTAKFQVYDDLGDVFRYYEALGNSQLAEWRFLLNWGNATQEQKEKWYSEYACHELNFFIYQKDREFFDKSIKPFLENKYQKTLVDRWLLEEDLTRYLRPEEFSRLNAFELGLLAARLPADDRDAIIRFMRDQFAMVPTDRDLLDNLFDAGIANSSMDEVAVALGAVFSQSEELNRQDALAPRPAAPGAGTAGLEAPQAFGGGGGGRGAGGMRKQAEIAGKRLARSGELSEMDAASVPMESESLKDKAVYLAESKRKWNKARLGCNGIST